MIVPIWYITGTTISTARGHAGLFARYKVDEFERV